ncbi:hypothetical protein F8O07_00970 [Pseudoclavibacter sp. CFCC 13796]|uniref:hypothetical protein n=1 Tax=Pseudoclavibacter sp. CFCC 13796 TaxID=2615179 RepID=UPI0013010873|nr:hypothetical protein [Pseudoclavibacter sp. CFCC 13796]KAB1660590.1 hypothetical protein F8O07_00970 [Pseudoclavibacter sp. CFCC 13796]
MNAPSSQDPQPAQQPPLPPVEPRSAGAEQQASTPPSAPYPPAAGFGEALRPRANRVAQKIPTNLWIAIGALIAVTLFVIVSLFFGDVPAKGGKVTVTVVYFAAFIGITIGELSIADRDRFYPVPLAIVSSVYVVAFGVMLTWIEPARQISDVYSYRSSVSTAGQNAALALGLLIPLIIAAKAPVAAARFTFKQAGENAVLKFLAVASAGLFSLLAVILFLPTLLQRSFRVDAGEWFGRLIVIVLMLAFLAISVFILLSWTFNADERRTRRLERQQRLAQHRQRPYGSEAAQWAAESAPVAPVATPAAAPEVPVHPEPAAHPEPAVTSDPVVSPVAAEEPAPHLPWPVFEDGITPLPVGADGRPAFSVLQPFPGRTEPVVEGSPEADAAIERARQTHHGY